MSRRILVLALGMFAVGTDGFVIAGILGDIASDLDVSLAVAGQLETAFALTIALGGPLLMTVLGGASPRRMLVVSLVVFTIANLLAALAPTFTVLMALRVLAACAVAVFMAAAPTAAFMSSSDEQRGRALSLVTAGLTAGIVAGVPTGILINHLINWQATFVFAACLGAVAAIAVVSVFPALPTPPAVSIRERIAVMSNPTILVMLASVTVWMLGGYTLYNFMGPMLEGVAGFDGAIISLLFLGFGATAVVGNILGGWLTDKIGPTRTIVCGLVGGGSGLVLVSLLGTSQVGVLLALTLWSTAGWMLSAPQQIRLVAQAPPMTGILMSLNASALYLGIGLGAVVGGLVLGVGSLRDLGWVGSLWEVAALGLVLLSLRLTAHRARDRGLERVPETNAVA